jgi:heme-degrading monooxygenase HmoA
VSDHVFYELTIEVDPSSEQDWLDWYRRVHVLDVLRQPGFARATFYHVETNSDEWARYIVSYEVESREALEAYFRGEAVQQLRADHYARFGGVTRASRQVRSLYFTLE